MNFCTTAGLFELAHARVLADRLAAHHPGARLTVLVMGRPPLDEDEPFDTLTPSQLGVRELDRIVTEHDAEDVEQMLRPHLVRHLLADEPVLFLDAAHDLLASLEEVEDLLRRHPVVLAPRLTGELPEDGAAPAGRDLRIHGRIDPGFVGVAPEETGERFLDWWGERAEQLAPHLTGTRATGHPEQGKRQLRRVLELAPSLFGDAALLASGGVEASAWNLHERPLERAGDAVLAAGEPLRSMSLVGYRPDRPHLLAPGVTRVTPAGDPVLAELLDGYRARLEGRGWKDWSRRADIGRRLANGLPFSDRTQRLYAEALADGFSVDDLFSPDGTRAFMTWLQESDGPGGGAGITRYLHRVYLDRGDLPRVYPDLDGVDGPEFAAWCWVYGQAEMDIPRELLPPRPAHLPAEPERSAFPPVEVAGYFKGTLGLGEAARLYVRALTAAGVPVHTTSVDPELPANGRPPSTAGYGRLEFEDVRHHHAAGANLICVNADELPRFAARAGKAFFAGRHNIGVWAWETDVIPPRWEAAYGLVDEIWVYSRYVAENLARAAPVPVVAMPPPVTPPAAGDEPELGLPDGFRFMFMFDFFSTTARKNPVGVIRAFVEAFAPGEGPHLVIKTINAGQRPEEFEELRYAANGRPDVFLVDASLSVGEKNGLLASCDCYVSLHRSEGYGLPLAECMAMGKPVIATAYSGNLDFMSPGNSYLVDYAETNVGADVEIYPAEGAWAEPDVEDAARQMRAVFDDREEAARRGARAAQDIARQLSPERVGEIARERLDRLAAAASRPGSPEPGDALDEARRELAFELDGGSPGPRRAARRALLRVLRPFTVHERRLDAALVRATGQLQDELAAQRREVERLRRELQG